MHNYILYLEDPIYVWSFSSIPKEVGPEHVQCWKSPLSWGIRRPRCSKFGSAADATKTLVAQKHESKDTSREKTSVELLLEILQYTGKPPKALVHQHESAISAKRWPIHYLQASTTKYGTRTSILCIGQDWFAKGNPKLRLWRLIGKKPVPCRVPLGWSSVYDFLVYQKLFLAHWTYFLTKYSLVRIFFSGTFDMLLIWNMLWTSKVFFQNLLFNNLKDLLHWVSGIVYCRRSSFLLGFRKCSP